MNLVKNEFYETPTGHRIVEAKFWPEKLRGYLRLEEEFLRADVKPNSDALEIGSGSGRILELLARIPCGRVVGIDKSLQMVQESRRRLRNHQNISIIHGDVRTAQFQANFFDYIFCMYNTFGNMDVAIQGAVLAKSGKWLRKRGRFFLSVYSENARETQIEFYRVIGLRVVGFDKNFVYTDQFVSERFSREKLKRIIADNHALKIREIKALNEISYLVELEK
jgi:SAM-dependent methyltransferase